MHGSNGEVLQSLDIGASGNSASARKIAETAAIGAITQTLRALTNSRNSIFNS